MSENQSREIFSRNLRHYMSLRGVNRAELSKALGIKYSTLSDWCNAKKYPRIEAIESLAAYFGVSKAALTEQEMDVTLDDFEYAFLSEAKPLSQENKEKLLEMARFFKTQQEKEEN